MNPPTDPPRNEPTTPSAFGPESEKIGELRNLASQVSTHPEFRAANTIASSLRDPGTTDTITMLNMLIEATAAVKAGDMTGPERMAVTQAMTLEFLFHSLVGKAMANLQNDHFEMLMRLALRAQSQSAKTLETLTTLKNPTFIAARQVNIGQQQIVSNGRVSKRLPRSKAPASPSALEAPREEIVRLPKNKIPTRPPARAPK